MVRIRPMRIVVLVGVSLWFASCSINHPQNGLIRSRCPSADDLALEMQEDPNNATVYDERAMVEVCNNQFDEALNDANHALALRPSAHDYSVRAAVYLSHGNNDLAAQDLRRAIQESPDEAHAYLGLGQIYSFEGKTELAKAYLQKALALGNADWMVLSGYAWVAAVSPDPQIRDGEAAVKYATRASELTQWTVSRALDTLAAAFARDGQYEQAVKWEKEAIKLDEGGRATEGMEARLALYQNHQPFTQTTMILER